MDRVEAEEIDNILNKTSGEKLNFWKTIKRIKRKENEEEVMEDENGRQHTEENKILEIKKNYYENLYKKRNTPEQLTEDQLVIRELQNAMDDETENRKEYNQPITIKELETSIREAKLNKAAGPDEITNEMIKYGDNILNESLLKVFNEIFDMDITRPEEWKLGDIISIFKGKGQRSKMKCQRGITLTSCILKILERIIGNRIEPIIKEKSTPL